MNTFATTTYSKHKSQNKLALLGAALATFLLALALAFLPNSAYADDPMQTSFDYAQLNWPASPDPVYDASTNTVTPNLESVTLNGETLLPGHDYRYSYWLNTDTGVVFVNLVGLNDYAEYGAGNLPTGLTDTSKVYFGSAGPSLSVELEDPYGYSGSAIEPDPVIEYEGTPLVKGTDYTLSYSNNTEPGWGTISITGMGSYAGTTSRSFQILKPGLNIIAGDAHCETPTTFTFVLGGVADPDETYIDTSTGQSVERKRYQYRIEALEHKVNGAFEDQINDLHDQGKYPFKDDNTFTFTFKAGGTYRITAYWIDHKNQEHIESASLEFNVTGAGSLDQFITNAVNAASGGTTQYKKAVLAYNYLLAGGVSYQDEPDGNGFVYTGSMGVLAHNKGNDMSFDAALRAVLLKLQIDAQPVQDANGNTWTLAYLDGKWTHIDAARGVVALKTNPDADVLDMVKHLYFGLTDDQIKYLHPTYESDGKHIANTTDANYLKNNNPKDIISGSTKIAEAKIVTDGIDKGLSSFTVEAAINVNGNIVPSATGFTDLVCSTVAAKLNGTMVNNTYVLVTYDPKGHNNKPGYKVTACVLSSKDIQVSNLNPSYIYTGSQIKPVPTLKLNGTVLKKDADFQVVNYTNNTNIGEAQIQLKGINKYSGLLTLTFQITPKSLQKAKVTGVVDKTYTGKAITQSPKVVLDGVTLTLNKDYKLEYSNNTKVGTATMKVVGINNYSSFVNPLSSFKIKAAADTINTAAVGEEPEDGWYQKNNKFYYYKKGKVQKGWQTIKNNKYYLDPSTGAMTTGWKTISGKKYYFNTQSGIMQTGTIQVSGKKYYMNSSGVMQTGWQTISKTKYYFDKTSGALKTGWLTVGTKKYFLDSSTGAMKTGKFKTGGKMYACGMDGILYTSQWVQLSSNWYYANSKGELYTGWKTIKGKQYYFNTSSGLLKMGKFKVGKKWYFSDESDGYLYKSRWITHDGAKFYATSSGVLKTGWWKTSKNTYYFNTSTAAMKKGWATINKKKYYFNSSGVMQTGWKQLSKKWYYLGTDGAMRKGAYKVSGKWYLSNSSGVMLKNGWKTYSGKKYYADSKGVLKTGWFKSSGKWYYLNPSNAAAKTGWATIAKKKYYFNSKGVMLTGWQKISGKKYYFDSNGIMQTSKWIGNYYVGKDGVMATNTWIGKYHVNANGKWDKSK